MYREIIAIYSQIDTKHVNTLCGQNVEFVNVKPGGTYSNHWALKGQIPYAGWLLIGHGVEQVFFLPFRSDLRRAHPILYPTNRRY